MSGTPIEPTAVISPGEAGGGSEPPPAGPSAPEWYEREPQAPAGGTVVIRESVYVEHHYIEQPPVVEAPAEPDQLPPWYHRNPRVRFTAFNLSAGLVGHTLLSGIGVNPYGGAALLAQVADDPVPFSVAVVTVGAAGAGYCIGRMFRSLAGQLSPVMGPVGAVCAGYWGQGTGPLLADLYADAGNVPGLAAPFVISAGAAGACWWLVERRAREWVLPGRWVARIPLAGVVLSSLLYTSWTLS